jgi:hypothetical protein
MIGMLLDRSIILSILPLLIAIPVALGLLIFLSHKLRNPPSKPISRTTGERFQKIGRTGESDVFTDSPASDAHSGSPYGVRDQLPELDDIDTMTGA